MGYTKVQLHHVLILGYNYFRGQVVGSQDVTKRTKNRPKVTLDDELTLVGSEVLATILNYASSQTVRNKLNTAPDTLPPRCVLPGSTKQSRNLWRISDIKAWLAAASQQGRVA